MYMCVCACVLINEEWVIQSAKLHKNVAAFGFHTAIPDKATTDLYLDSESEKARTTFQKLVS